MLVCKRRYFPILLTAAFLAANATGARAQVTLPYVEDFEGASPDSYYNSTDQVTGAPGVSFTSGGETVGPADRDIGAGALHSGLTERQEFDASAPVVLDGVWVYPSGPGDVVVRLLDASLQEVSSVTVPVAGSGPTYIPCRFYVPAGAGYALDAVGTTVSLYRNTAGAVYPYVGGDVTITGSSTGLSGYYGFFYDWQVHPIAFNVIIDARNSYGGGSDLHTEYDNGMRFDVTETVIINSVYVGTANFGTVVVRLLDSNSVVLDIATHSSPGSASWWMPVGFVVEPGTGYMMDVVGTTVPSMHAYNHGSSYPYTTGRLTLTGPITVTGYASALYWFSQWNVTEPSGGRLRITDNAHTGNAAATLDKHHPGGAEVGSGLHLTLDMSNYSVSADVVDLRFWALRHGGQADVGDRVWIRGSADDDWLEALDLHTALPTPGMYTELVVPLSDTLAAAGQELSATFEVRFGQMDTDVADTLTTQSGLSIDDILLELRPICGNASLEGAEVCDDGNTSDCDGCRGDCLAVEFGCGDGAVCGAEQCDDGNTVSCDGCSAGCLNETGCGDTVLCGAEQCDDGNADNTDDCLATCQQASCGDGFTQTGVEECDDGNADDSDACPSTCQQASCGDGFVQAGVEECDDGNASDTDACLTTCVLNVCGDQIVHVGVEECDDGNADDTDECLSSCVLATCGDGILRSGQELCDDGNSNPADGCNTSCTVEHGFSCAGQPSVCQSTCGDGLVASDEPCDDGNTAAGDGCDPQCAIEAGYSCAGEPSACAANCGDGILLAPESCDDGGLTTGDGCDETCQVEPGWVCTGEPSQCNALCGNGQLDPGEECDDGNTIDGEGCDSACLNEAGWVCTGEPSICQRLCGNNQLDPDEECDDGNLAATDGCDSSCHVQSGWLCAGEPSTCCPDADDDGQCDDDGGDAAGGCGCRTSSPPPAGALWLMLLALLAWLRRRAAVLSNKSNSGC